MMHNMISLMFMNIGPAIFKLKGRNVSDVTLNGYLEAPKDDDLEISDDLDDDMYVNLLYLLSIYLG